MGFIRGIPLAKKTPTNENAPDSVESLARSLNSPPPKSARDSVLRQRRSEILPTPRLSLTRLCIRHSMLAHDRPVHTDPLATGCLDSRRVDSKRVRQGDDTLDGVPVCLLSSHLCREPCR